MHHSHDDEALRACSPIRRLSDLCWFVSMYRICVMCCGSTKSLNDPTRKWTAPCACTSSAGRRSGAATCRGSRAPPASSSASCGRSGPRRGSDIWSACWRPPCRRCPWCRWESMSCRWSRRCSRWCCWRCCRRRLTCRASGPPGRSEWRRVRLKIKDAWA